jgi:hypothetical protein
MNLCPALPVLAGYLLAHNGPERIPRSETYRTLVVVGIEDWILQSRSLPAAKNLQRLGDLFEGVLKKPQSWMQPWRGFKGYEAGIADHIV